MHYGHLLGEVLITGHDWNPATQEYDRVTIDRADPRSMISTEMLDHARRGELRHCSLDGDVLTLYGSNRKVVYRIGEYDYQCDAYHMQWPD